MIFKLVLNIPKEQIINSCLLRGECTWNASDTVTGKVFIFSSFPKKEIERYSQLKGNDSSSIKVELFLGKGRITAEMS